jgi:hypothetical protein
MGERTNGMGDVETGLASKPGEIGGSWTEFRGRRDVGRGETEVGTLLPFFGRPQGLENLDDGDFFIPRYRLIQPGWQGEGERPGRSRVGPSAGGFSGPGPEDRDHIDLVPLKVQKGRVCWGDEAEAEPFCRSADNFQPDPIFWEHRSWSPPSQVCGKVVNGRWQPVCPLAHWEGDARPPCHQVYNLLFLDADRRLPFLMSFHGAAVKPVRTLLTQLIRMRLRRLCEVTVRLGAVEVEGPDLTYFVPVFSDLRRNAEGEYVREFEALRRYDPRKTFEAEAAEGREGAGVAVGLSAGA